MITNPDAAWANRAAKAILLIRILVGWSSFPKAFRNFFSPIHWELDGL